MPVRWPDERCWPERWSVMTDDDARWMELAISLAWKAPRSTQAYSVGAVIVGADGRELSRGFSREGGDLHAHAEESALTKLGLGAGQPAALLSGALLSGAPVPGAVLSGALLSGATLYSTLEPCSQRKSRPRSCTQLILATRSAAAAGNAGIRRVVVAWREPGVFVADCQGVELLALAGIEVTELGELAELAKAPNRHLDV
jgi:diaminohydroxyphosphoribosylaminopyrimidine deaminase / 5-amino-6-(5-phosphoribosylamino)uracil reductase